MSGYDLIGAITFNDLPTVHKLLSAEPSLTTFRTYDLRTPLHHACMQDRPHIVRHLLTHSTKALTLRDAVGDTPIDLAKRHGNLATLRCLSELGVADLCLLPVYAHARDLMLACAYGSGEDVRRNVGLFGAWVNWRNCSGRSPLHWAVVRGDEQIVRALLKLGADPGRCDRKGISPVVEAGRMGGKVLDAFEEVL